MKAWQTLSAWLVGALLAVGIALVLSLPVSPHGQVTLQQGQVAPRDIRAPRRITYVSNLLTQEAREQAATAILPVYTPPDPAVARAQVARARQILDFIRAVRADPLATPAEKRAALQAIEGLLLPRLTLEQILAHSNESWARLEAEIITVIDLAMRGEIRDTTLAETRARLPALVSTDLNDEQIQIVSTLASALIIPNSFYDQTATQAARDQARAAVKEITRTYEAGQVVVREGALVTAMDIEALQNLDLLQSRADMLAYVANALIALLVMLVLTGYIRQFEVELSRRPRLQLLLILLGLGYLLIARIIIPGRTVLPYLLPSAMVPLLVAALVSPPLAILTAILLGGVTGMIAGGSLEQATYAAGGGLAAALTLGRIERLSAFFRAGLYSAIANIGVVLAFRLPAHNTDLLGLTTLLGSGLAAGLLAAALALAALYIIGGLFDVVTTPQLLDLARPNHPLLNLLLTQTTGTYHHTLMVANLAEQAAECIGANALLARVGALYHDVGKTARPYMFVENQIGRDNIHERLDPTTSMQVIMSHIKDGLELAHRHRLPSRICAFIPEHHGTLRAGFLYHKAIELAGGDASKVDESAFRYPGPKPQSKETALVMLADGCEAAVRARQPHNKQELAEIIRQIIADRLADGQLSESPLTLRDLECIHASFINTLQGIFHPRLQYPIEKSETAAAKPKLQEVP